MNISSMKWFRSRTPFYFQTSSMDCSIACLKMISAFYGKRFSTEYIRLFTDFERSGVSMFGLSNGAKRLGFEVDAMMISLDNLRQWLLSGPLILHWNKNHFVVLYSMKGNKFLVADPAKGMIGVDVDHLIRSAFYTDPVHGDVAYIMRLTPTPDFHLQEEDKEGRKRQLAFLSSNIRQYKVYFFIIMWGLLLGLGAQFFIPFFTQSVVDLGIRSADLQFVAYVLLGQAVMMLSTTLFGILRGWITLHLSTRINFSLLSVFLQKLFKVPLLFFETRKVSDILQRITDHHRIEVFLTRVLLNLFFSLLTIIVYSIVLAYYNLSFLLLFYTSAILYLGWIALFMKKRKIIDWKRFEMESQNQSVIIQIVNGIHDLKVNNAHDKFYEKWRGNQVELVKNDFNSMRLSQVQETGASIIFQLSQIGITFLSVKLVIGHQLTMGAMLSVQFIIGQLIMPIGSIVSALISGQDAKLSFERLMDIWSIKNEEELRTVNGEKVNVPAKGNIVFKDLTFRYPGQQSDPAINNLNLEIPHGKTTAIVGLSGSGKTSILKLLLGYYTNYTGQLSIGGVDINQLDLNEWRNQCGVVLQESYLFSDTIAKNIAMDEHVDYDRLLYAMKLANIHDYVEELPMKHHTVIGAEGKGISQGQRQRILIARAIYKDPKYILLDEATNSLDAENEHAILDNLTSFFKGKTVVIIAHRLSTVQFVDHIQVIDKGMVAENGSHDALISRQGKYYELIKRQMAMNLVG